MTEFSDDFDEEKKPSTNLGVGETVRLGVLPTEEPVWLTTPIEFPTYFDVTKQNFLEINDDRNFVLDIDNLVYF